jgi:EpsD family peptidyl-prolyl cis-trans isomerase
MVDRQVLVGSAVDQGLDKNPQFLAETRRAEHVLLARLALEGMSQQVPQPSHDEVQRFASQNREMFAERQKLTLDQIRFSPATALSSREIAALDAMEGSESLLRSKGVQLQRGSVTVDTLLLPRDLVQQIVRMPTGKLFFVKENDTGMLSRIVTREAAPVPEAERAVFAQRLLQQQTIAEALRNSIAARRSGTDIRFQEGYGPPEQRSASGAKADRAPSTPTDER